MSTGNIVSLFLSAAGRHPERDALVCGSKSMSYAGLLKEVRQTAGYYTKQGIGRGDKVLVFVPMRIDLYRIVLSLFYIGACPVFIDEWVSVDRLNKCCGVVDCKAMIADGKFLLLSYFVAGLRRIKTKISSGKKANEDIAGPPCAVVPTDTALITFTTGSTGLPKAANRTHDFLLAQFKALTPYVDDGFNPVLVTLPIVVLINLGLGKTTVLPGRGFAVKKPRTISVLESAMRAHRPETIITSPSVLHRLIARKPYAAAYSLQKIITGGGPVLPELAAAAINSFPGVTGMAVYGSTEAEPISHIAFEALATTTPDNIFKQGLPVGKVDEALRIAIVPYVDGVIPAQTSASWQRMWLNDSVGEIVVAGNHVLKAYINNEQAILRNKVRVDGELWHRTGDAGRLNDAGRLHFYGLCKEVVVWNGRTLYPVLVAQLLKAYAGVGNAALLMTDSGPVVVWEGTRPADEQVLNRTLEMLGLGDVHKRYVKKIPTDPRHQTKIEYDKLRDML